MNPSIKLVSAIAAILAVASCTGENVRTAEALAVRILGDKADKIVFEQLEATPQDTSDVFEIETLRGKVHIRGNNANSMAVGLNHYLHHYCLASVSWYDYNPVELPATLPDVPEKIRVNSRMQERFFLNYCTFGYTMPWWNWEQWERFIDWMALNGVNMPLAITGQEAVWQKVWRKYGMSDEQIRAYFTGPAHLPWHRMCNIDRWQGPLPQDWIDSQAELQKRIVERERAFNMTPILPGFAGHIPAELADCLPQIDTFRVSYWGGFPNENRCTFLSPMDSMFSVIQKDFIAEQTAMYGTDHIYGVDPFNEIQAPFWDPVSLARMGSGIFGSMLDADPKAHWLQMGWLFYNDKEHWTKENIEAYLTSVPAGRMTILDYYCDRKHVWKDTEKFFGQDYLWCYLDNFGGMTSIEGDMQLNIDRIEETFRDGGPGFRGIGSTIEGFGVNEHVLEHVLSTAWDTGISLDDYVSNLADRHLGRIDDTYRAAWHLLVDSVSVRHEKTGSSSMLVVEPLIDGKRHWTTSIRIGYRPQTLLKVKEMMESVKGESVYYRYDLCNVTRQTIGNSAKEIYDAYVQAYKKADRSAMDRYSKEFLALYDTMEATLAQCREFSLQDWLDSARSWGDTPEQKAYYEKNARTLVTIWGSKSLNDYANRDWAGLMGTYYKVRWEMFFDEAAKAMDEGRTFDEQACREKIWQFSLDWTDRVSE